MTETVPADIAAAIDRALSAANDYGRVFSIDARKREDAARAALDAAILHHLRAYAEMKAALEVQTSGGA